MDIKTRNWLISGIRKLTYRYQAKHAVKAKAKTKVGEFSTGKPRYKYACASCGELFMEKDVVVDHINPVVPLKGYKSGKDHDWDEYLDRMFCGESGLQVLCATCHNAKSKDENETRKEYKNKKK